MGLISKLSERKTVKTLLAFAGLGLLGGCNGPNETAHRTIMHYGDYATKRLIDGAADPKIRSGGDGGPTAPQIQGVPPFHASAFPYLTLDKNGFIIAKPGYKIVQDQFGIYWAVRDE